ncbi:MAG: MotA/TolQ/ExbB proton channel family protein [Candidatus Aminicenantes bacterium]|nr:MotA/TolQ/ExbB proton channel family protein [Candidatus Aminicenantes bacterium]
MKHILFLVNPVNHNGDFIYLIKNASVVVKLVLLLLLTFSIVSWAVIIFKIMEYRRARKNSQRFLEFFKKNKNFSEINANQSLYGNNPLGEIFRYGYREISLQSGRGQALEKLDLDSVHRALLRASNSEITRFERLNGFLATCASATPFIGLFGTVWGIMSSFQQIGIQMNANLATVAPGIAEALIATALGLFAAIPAVVFYNLLLNKLKVLIAMMEDFVLEFLNLSEKLSR